MHRPAPQLIGFSDLEVHLFAHDRRGAAAQAAAFVWLGARPSKRAANDTAVPAPPAYGRCVEDDVYLGDDTIFEIFATLHAA